MKCTMSIESILYSYKPNGNTKNIKENRNTSKHNNIIFDSNISYVCLFLFTGIRKEKV